MSPLLRNILAIIAGTLLATVVMFLLETAYGKMARLPQGVSLTDLADPAKAKAAMQLMPMGAFGGILVIYAFCAFIGGLTATLISGKKRVLPAVATGLILMVSGLTDGVQMAEPVRFMVAMSAEFILFSWLGFIIVKKKEFKTSI